MKYLLYTILFGFCWACVPSPITKKDFEKYLPANPVILEAGAYDGSDTLEMATLWPQATIFAFEPVPDSYQLAKEKTKKCANVAVIQAALSPKNGEIEFFVSSGMVGAQSSSMLEPNHHLTEFPKVLFNKVIKVPAINIDSWAKQQGVTHIDCMWLDMQGAECAVLRACPNILSTVKVLITEVNFIELYKGCVLFEEFRTWLESQGFQLIKLQNKRTFGDALFVRLN